MPICTLNGIPVAEAVIDIPRIGVWHADLLVNSFTSFTGSAIIQFGSQSFNGTVSRNGPDITKHLRARVLGGAGALSSILVPKGYRSVPLKIPLQDVLNSCGEKLSTTSDNAILGLILDVWSRLQMTGGQAIDALLQKIVRPGVQNSSTQLPSWRVLVDGSIWVGYEYWTDSKLKDAIPLYSEPERGTITIHSLDPIVLPGEVLSYQVPRVGIVTRKISYVRHILKPRFIHTVLYYEDS